MMAFARAVGIHHSMASFPGCLWPFLKAGWCAYARCRHPSSWACWTTMAMLELRRTVEPAPSSIHLQTTSLYQTWGAQVPSQRVLLLLMSSQSLVSLTMLLCLHMHVPSHIPKRASLRPKQYEPRIPQCKPDQQEKLQHFMAGWNRHPPCRQNCGWCKGTILSRMLLS